MRNRPTLALASVLVSMVGSGAQAGPIPDDHGGWTCGVVAYSTDSHHWSGTLQGGPWSVADPEAQVEMTCLIQVNGPEGWVTVASAVSPRTNGVTALPPRPVSYELPLYARRAVADAAEAPANMQACTQITVYKDGQPPTVYPVDADGDPTNGAQCEKSTRADNELVYVTVVPTKKIGRICVSPDDSDLPEKLDRAVPDTQCLPG